MFQITSYYVKILAGILSEQTEITLNETDKWEFDWEHKVLHYNPRSLIALDRDSARGVLLHEMAHVKFTKPSVGSDLYHEFPAIGKIYDAFEDIRVNQFMKQKYGDYADKSLDLKEINGVINQYLNTPIAERDKLYEYSNFFKHLFLLQRNRIGYHPSYYPANLVDRIVTHPHSYLNKDVAKALDKTNRQFGYSQIIKALPSFRDFKSVQNFVDREIYPIIKDLIENDPDNEQLRQQLMAGAAQAQAQAGQGDPQDGEGDEQAPAMPMPSPMAEGDGMEAKPDKDGKSHTFSLDRGDYGDREIIPYREARAMTRHNALALAHRLKNILRENKAMKITGNHKHGKLLSRNITKLIMGEERVFSKRNKISDPFYHCMIALDGSGSMTDDNKDTNAYLGTVTLMQVFEELNMKTTVLEFSGTVKTMVTENKVDRKFESWNPMGGGTDDRLAAHEVVKLMKKYPREDFITFFIGDGDGVGLDKDDVDYIEKRGLFIGIGIGRGTDSVVHRYPKGIVVHDPNDLSRVLLSQIKSHIKRI